MASKISTATAADRSGKWTLKSTAHFVTVAGKPMYCGKLSRFQPGTETVPGRWVSEPALLKQHSGVGGYWWV